MEITLYNKSRGITGIFDGSRYYIMSSYYGLIAYSTKIKRNDKDTSVLIHMKISDVVSGINWSAEDIIRKGIRASERFFKDNKKVDFKISYEKDFKYRLKVGLRKKVSW